MSSDLLWMQETHERVYCCYTDRFLKRSLAPHEYKKTQAGKLHVPVQNKERLENEVACLKYIKKNTNIPVPKVLDAYDENGSFHVWTERIQGVELKTLPEPDRQQVIPQVLKHLETLHALQSDKSGGPSGLTCPQNVVAFDCDHNTVWNQMSSKDNLFVFCHCDLSQTNILVDPKTLNIVAIIDWEYSGYYPEGHEIPFYKSPEPSGRQINHRFPREAEKIIEFWKDLRK